MVLFSFLIDGKMDKFSINFWLLPIIAGVMWAAVGSKIAAGTDIFADINPAREPREQLCPALLALFRALTRARLSAPPSTQTAVAGAMTSNICFALRGTLSKKVTSAIPKEKNLTSTNLYALMTFICFFLCMPFAAVIEVRRRERARRPARRRGVIGRAVRARVCRARG